MPSSEYVHANVPDDVTRLLLGGRSQEPDNTEADAIGRVFWPGYILTLLSCVFFAIAAACVKSVTMEQRMPSVTAVYFASVVMSCFAIFCIGLGRKARESLTQLDPVQLGGTFVRGLLGAATILLLYKAIELLPVGQADAAYYVTPVFAMVFAAASLRERILITDVMLACGSIVGVMMIASPAIFISLSSHDAFIVNGENFRRERILGICCALFAAFFNAMGLVLTRSLTHNIHFLHFVFVFGVCGVLVTTMTGHAANPFLVYKEDAAAFFLAISAGLCTSIAQTLMHASLYFVPAGRASLVGNCEVPLVYLIAIFFLRESPTLVPFLGSVIVVTSSLIIGIRHLCRR